MTWHWDPHISNMWQWDSHALYSSFLHYARVAAESSCPHRVSLPNPAAKPPICPSRASSIGVCPSPRATAQNEEALHVLAPLLWSSPYLQRLLQGLVRGERNDIAAMDLPTVPPRGTGARRVRRHRGHGCRVEVNLWPCLRLSRRGDEDEEEGEDAGGGGAKSNELTQSDSSLPSMPLNRRWQRACELNSLPPRASSPTPDLTVGALILARSSLQRSPCVDDCCLPSPDIGCSGC